MRTTDAPITDDPKARAKREAAERARLNAEAERVMNESKPTPSQAEVDAIVLGEMDHDEKEEVDNPSMPPLHEQRQRIAEAGGAAPYRTRDAAAVRRDAEEDRRAVPRREEAARAEPPKASESR